MLWPNNKRLALMLSFDIDAETLWLTRNENQQKPPRQPKPRAVFRKAGHSPHFADAGRRKPARHLFYHGLHGRASPEVIKCIAACGHEIAYHGYLHEVYDTYKKENALMAKAENIIKSLTGRQMVGQRSRTALYTIFTFSCGWTGAIFIPPTGAINDGPFLHKINGKTVPIVELPKDGIVDDTSYDMYTIQAPEHHYLRSGREMTGIWMEEFDGLAMKAA